MSDACVTDSFARAKEAWSGSIRSPYPDGVASSGSYPPVESLRHGRGRCQSRMRVDRLQCRAGGRIAPVNAFARVDKRVHCKTATPTMSEMGQNLPHCSTLLGLLSP